MRIALNAQLLSSAASYRAAGINRVLQHLLAELPNVAGDEQYLVYAPYSDANRRLTALAALHPDIHATTEAIVGHPPEAIVRTARDRAADLIVAGTHGRGGVARMFMGSVAERVVRLAECPVLTVRDAQDVGPALASAAAAAHA